MTRDQAIKILDRALEDYRQRLSWDANLYRKGVDTAQGKRAADKLDELNRALELLIGPIQLSLLEDG